MEYKRPGNSMTQMGIQSATAQTISKKDISDSGTKTI